MQGIYLKLPFGLGSVWVERHTVSVGFDQRWNSDRTDWEFFAGSMQGSYSLEGKRRAIAIANAKLRAL